MERPEEEESIGQRVKRLRAARGWSLDRLAQEARKNEGSSVGLSRGTIHEMERNPARVPWDTTLRAIASALDVPVEYLRSGKMSAEEDSLSDFTPEMYAMAQGLKDPEYIRQWAEHLNALKLAEVADEQVVEVERGLDSYSVEEFARAKGLKDEQHIAKFQQHLEKLLSLEEFEVE
jgi:transcriptional regulator with XRE-family HTH domain